MSGAQHIARIMSNVNGLGDENLHECRFALFYRKDKELDVSVFIHSNNVLG